MAHVNCWMFALKCSRPAQMMGYLMPGEHDPNKVLPPEAVMQGSLTLERGDDIEMEYDRKVMVRLELPKYSEHRSMLMYPEDALMVAKLLLEKAAQAMTETDVVTPLSRE